MSCGALSDHGKFIANIDLSNIKIDDDPTGKYVKDMLTRYGLLFDQRKKLFICEGVKVIKFGVSYQGASDQAGPNYTGQEAVNSYYKA